MIFKRPLAVFFILSCVCSFKLAAQELQFNLHAETWDIQRHGEVLLKIPVLKSVVEKWSENPKQRIELRYPGGEEGELWVEELQDWFISLGISSSALQASPGSNAQDIINIILINSVNVK